MWVCPKCGRSFKYTNQQHYCGEKPKTIDDYIAGQPDEKQPYLRLLRAAISECIPDAQERISWSMPTFWEKHNIIQFASHKNHIGLYAGVEAVAAFSERLADYKTSKGAIQLPFDKPLPIDLVKDIALWCVKTGNHV